MSRRRGLRPRLLAAVVRSNATLAFAAERQVVGQTESRRGSARMFIAVPLLMLWYTANAVLSRFAGTCTMGDTDRFVAGMIIGAPGAAGAMALLFLAPTRTGWRMAGVLATGLLAFMVLWIWVPLALSAGIHGHHLCGPEFDEYLAVSSRWERFIPLAHVMVASVLIGGMFRNVRRAWGAAQPAVAADGASPRR